MNVQFGEVDVSRKHKIRGTGQQNVIVNLSPLDGQNSAVENDFGAPRPQTSARSGSHGSTRSGSTGARDPHTSLPNAHAQLSRLEHADELDIDAMGKQRMTYYLRTENRYGSSIGI